MNGVLNTPGIIRYLRVVNNNKRESHTVLGLLLDQASLA